jgi:Protein of unknown function (DUF3313)
MKTFTRIAIAFLLSTIGAVSALAQTTGGEADALVKIKAKKVDQAYLLPGADFSAYKKVIIAPSEVAFQKNWLRDMKNQAMSLSYRISDKDAQKILEAARSGFDEIWAEAFKAAGYEVVTTPGADVLKLVPGVFDLYINAPDVPTAGRSKSYTVEAGEAGLNLEVRDSVSGTLLGRVVDKRTAGVDMGQMQWTTSVSNRSDFSILFKQWAKIAANGLGELAKASPLPETLQPNKKLPTK